MAAAA
jgi:hypothetical protein